MIVPEKELTQLPENANLEDLGVTINHNYIQYHLVVQQIIDLQNWIKEQLNLKKETSNGN